MIDDNIQSYYKKIKSALICPVCIIDVEQLLSEPLSEYLIICEFFNVYKKPLKNFSREHGCGTDQIQELEKKGYITTTESSKELIYHLPRGYLTSEGEFCACNGKHE